jgi:hypothetical protein
MVSLKSERRSSDALTLEVDVYPMRLAILMKGMPLFTPYSFRSKAIVPAIVPEPVPLPETVSVNISGHAVGAEPNSAR